MTTSKVISLASIIVDVTLQVPYVPEPGGDVLATAASDVVGGGFNLVSAAARQGVRCVYAGAIGSGRFGKLAGEALARERVVVPAAPREDGDTGFCINLVEPSGERTFVTMPGVEALLTADDLAKVQVDPCDVLVLSGYDLLYPQTGPHLANWVSRLPPGPRVILDPGPLIAEIPSDRLTAALRRVDVLTLNMREAALLTGQSDTRLTKVALLLDLEEMLGRQKMIVLRAGSAGCISTGPELPTYVDVVARQVDVRDTTGAGDTHCGVLAAWLAMGRKPMEALTAATVAATHSVTCHGPATAPDLRTLRKLLATSP